MGGPPVLLCFYPDSPRSVGTEGPAWYRAGSLRESPTGRLYYNTDLQVKAATGSALTIEGSRVSMGMSADAARESALRIHVRTDHVADYLESGPHPGEMFAGTNRIEELPETHACSTADHWSGYCQGRGYGVGNLAPGAAFPELAERFNPFSQELAMVLKDAVRISLVQDQAQALTLPPDAHRPRLHKVFRPNASDKRWLHGPLGYAALTVSVPAGARLVVVRADEVEVRDLQASVYLMQCRSVKAEGITGDVFLVDSPIETEHRIRGRLYQRWYSFGGMDWLDDEMVARRSRLHSCSIEDVEGEIDVEVGRADLELARCRGPSVSSTDTVHRPVRRGVAERYALPPGNRSRPGAAARE